MRPIDWRSAALILATLFLNFHFWFVHGSDLWMFYPLPLYAGLLGAAALLITALFFVGPALATQTSRRSLYSVVENSLGSIPALGVRLCCVLFLVLWMATLVAVPGLWWLGFIRRHDVSTTESAMIVVGILVFLFVTGLQSLQISAKLALFTNKLGIAILVAALLRVHPGWPAILKGFPGSGERSAVSDLWHGLSQLAFYVAPLAFLAANFRYRSQGRKQVAMTALMGVTLPLFGSLLLVGVINVATFSSGFYQPSLTSNVAMALWGQAAGSSLPGRMMVTAITEFGAVRFGATALAESVGRRLRCVLMSCLIGVITWLSLHQDLSTPLEISATCLAVAAAVLTADVVIGTRVERVRKIDWVGFAALLAGLATHFLMQFWSPAESWWHPWLLPSYGVAFLVCLLGRVVAHVAKNLNRENHACG